MTRWSYVERARGILAREEGTIVKDWGGKLPIALVYPNTYRVGMSGLGYQTVYRLFNGRDDVVCERAFWQPRFAEDDPILSLESQRPISDASVIAFSLSYEMDYPHLVHVLRQAGIPLHATDRDKRWPAVIAGGPAVSANPLPVADLLDAAVVGEAEELIDPLIDALLDGLDRPRDALWRALVRVPGVYVPHIAPEEAGPVRRQWVHEIDTYPTATVVHTPDTEFGDMHLVEIARGCGRGCRFCMAGFTCRPKREHSVDSIVAQARRGLSRQKRIGLVGAAVSDYTQIDALVIRLREMGARLSVSSLRVDALSEPLLQALAEGGARTLTLAPEAGSARLRHMINKGITEADLLRAAERAAHYGFRQLKLYFMIGLPTESWEDIEAICTLCEAVAARFGGHVIANVTPFVPKAHTPFQWAPMAPSGTLEARFKTLRQHLQRQRIDVRGESPQWAAIQGTLARGDRRMGAVLTALRGKSIGAWRKAMVACDVNPEDYLRARNSDERLPWAFIHTGVHERFLRQEWERAQAGAPTLQCPSRECT